MENQPITRDMLAEHFDVSVSTIRKWEREFDAWLETPPGQKGQGVKKEYLEQDVVVMSVIHQLREEGVSYDDIKRRLDKELETATFTFDAERIGQEPKDKDERAVVPREQYALLLGRYEATEHELERVARELHETRQLAARSEVTERQLDRLREELDKTREQMVDAERRAAAGDEVKNERDRLVERLAKLEAKLDERLAPATPETSEPNELQQRLEELERELREEQAKTWWQKLRGR